MLNNILRNLPFGRRPVPRARPYGRMGGGVLLPALAYFGWKYRDRIKSFVRSRFGSRHAPAGGHMDSPYTAGPQVPGSSF
jgi:hypothetical protein